MDGRVRRAALVLVLLGSVVHLWGLSRPREVIFDEVTFGKIVAAYCCTGERIFDVHPPHGKLLIAAAARLGGFDGRFDFDHIGMPYGDVPVFALRLVPALAGIAIAPLFLLLLVELGASFPTACLGGLMLALDNGILAETRIIVWDGVLVASTVAALVCFFKGMKRDAGRLTWLIGAGALGGFAIGCKLTGLAALALMFFCLAFGLAGASGSLMKRAREGTVLLACAAAVYIAGWAVHLLILTRPGPADAFYTTTGNFVQDFIAVNSAMWRENVHLSATHPDASAPWTWPWMKVAPYFWQGKDASMYLVGNPVVWWGSSLALIALLLQGLLLRPLGIRRLPAIRTTPQPWIALAGYLIAFVPLMPIGRVLFLYHYLTPLIFAVAFVLLWLDRFGAQRPDTLRGQPAAYYVVVALTIAGFLAMSPLSYGISFGGYDEWLASVVRSWR